MTQSTLTIGGFDTHSKDTRKVAFLARMDKLVPCSAWEGLIEPHYPKAGSGRPPRDLSTMPRMYCVANWFDLADEACEDALYDVSAFRGFCSIELGRQSVPDATTLLNDSQQMGNLLHARETCLYGERAYVILFPFQ